MKNHLQHTTSPYLLQHADNPVAWFPWGEEALNSAKQNDKPILLSIGYAACHWCHVMAHESFEDPETAAMMNDHFVCIKVDREERPDLDQIYMAFVQMTTGSGGWPLNVFLTPDLEPFYGGTYFPPEDRYGRPSWKKILLSVSRFYHEDKASLQANLHSIRQAYAMSLEETAGDALPSARDLTETARELASLYDPVNGGLGGAPKFPAVQPLTYFLKRYHRDGDTTYLDMSTVTLHKMARGGIYDQLGGGFARYAVDERWLIPHFEKMLYDNAQLAVLYIEAFQLTGDPLFEAISRGILDFVGRELRHGQGGFYSSLDADSEGTEGKYYVWDRSEIEAVLGGQSDIFCDYYGVTPTGNFEGKNILYIPDSLESTAARFNKSASDVAETLKNCAMKLKAARDKRVRPGLDDKILTSWNALMISAYARAVQVFGDQEYQDLLRNSIEFIRTYLIKDQRLYRSFSRGKTGIPGYLDDYAYLIKAMIDAYEALFHDAYLELAGDLMKAADSRFYDDRNSGYFFTCEDHGQLIYHMKDIHDQSVPSASGVMLQNLLRMHTITGAPQFRKNAENMMRRYLPECRKNPYAFGSYLIGMDYYLAGPYEIVIVARKDQSLSDLLAPVYRTYLPHRQLLLIREEDPLPLIAQKVRAGKKTVDGKPAVYLCHNFSCSPPLVEPAEIERVIRS